ncbi:MAG: flagellar biosynthesis protein FlhA [Candidatus Kapabacteria bacterium]|nr:flagellar biosynthesis protein FlhA [Ignavibacteriota bacterium]MCW5885212.1 flagellar biosynthesis protein FlhA [Candidatus Kapabacteria bacterium]
MAKNNQIEVFNNPTVQKFRNNYGAKISANTDILLAGSVLLVIGLLIIPLPGFMLDLFLTINIAVALLIIMVSLYLRNPLDLASFPTMLLMTTLFRLGLNVASTRLILGEAEAGQVIEAFGQFVIKGNYVVGIIIFLILVIINFVVIIKGSSRIAEVTARFTLDALPGKQMSIDADLNAGYIDEQTARKRRDDLSKEADFFGAMDGAAKFIKGDAIAGLIITAINILGGFAIGVLQRDMAVADAASTYTILTIGDGLVSQIPSLLISIAAGLVVTRSASTDNLDIELGKQFGSNPKPLLMSSAALVGIGLLPGFPFFPFLLLASFTGFAGIYRIQSIKNQDNKKLAEEIKVTEEETKPQEQPVEELLKIDPVEIELGYNLISLVDETQGGDVFKRITNIRRQIATDLGLILPPVRVRDNLQLEPDEYIIKIRSNEIARNILHPNMLLAMNPGTAEGDIPGIKVTEPVFGLPATWISNFERENAEIKGYTVVEAPTVLTTHLTELLRRNAEKLLTRQDVKHLMDNLKDDYPALLEEINPDNLPISTLQKILQRLLSEGIPIRDLPLILESLIEYYKVTKNTDVLTEYVRHNLSETIKKLYQDNNGVIHAISLDAVIEDSMTKALQANNQNALVPSLGLSPDTINSIHQSLSACIDDVTMSGYLPVVICSAQVRPYFYRMIHTTFPMVSVISYSELPAETDIEILSSLRV